MDGVSAVASFIAIAQALAAVPKILGILRSVVKSGEELRALLDEVGTC
jgi:hypothetical protein